MLQRWFGPKAYSRLHYFTLLLFVVGMVCSKFLMSMGLLIGLLSLLFEANFKAYMRRLAENRLVHLLLLFYLFFWLSLFWTQNLTEGFDQLRRLTSLLLIPLIIAARPLPSPTKTAGLWSFFLGALLLTSVVNEVSFHFFAKELQLIDIRKMSLFGSHIRYGILIGFGLSLALFRARSNYWYYLLACWFIYYTLDSQALSGVLTVLIVLLGHAIYFLLQKRKLAWVIGLGFVSLLLTVSLIYYLAQPIANRQTCPSNQMSMAREWQKRSKLPFEGQDLRGQDLSATVERYVQSKNGCAAAYGIRQLSAEDIRLIELGFADVREAQGGIVARLFGLRYQLHHSNNPNDHSLLERIEYWRNATSLLSDHWLLGVGVGDLKDQMQQRYEERASQLRPDRRLRPHNYYLTTWLNLGILGLVLFLLLVGLFIKQQLRYGQLQGLLIGISLACTLFIEDGLETQMGLTIFAFFMAFYSRRVVQ
ncbi:MAG: O-antigen ligase family protein [Flavobacteriales bacterium]